jgi:dihydrodipicolinate synthase/N-acetylneuraminate lyase
VTQGARIPAGSLVLGAPAEVVRTLTHKEREGLREVAEKYVRLAAFYRTHRESLRKTIAVSQGLREAGADGRDTSPPVMQTGLISPSGS